MKHGWSMLLLGACTAAPDTTDGSDTTDTMTHEMAEQLGCEPGLDVFERVAITETSSPTVLRLEWESSVPLQAKAVSDVGREGFLVEQFGVLGERVSDLAEVVVAAWSEEYGLSHGVLVPAVTL